MTYNVTACQGKYKIEYIKDNNIMTYNVTVCQANKKQKFLDNNSRRLEVYRLTSLDPDLKKIKDRFTDSKRSKKCLLVSFTRLILIHNRYKIPLYASEKYIASKLGCAVNSVSRIVGQAADLGIIYAKQRSFNGTNEYFVNPAFNIPAVQHALTYFFSFFKGFALTLLFSSATHLNLNGPLVQFTTTDVNLIKKGYIYIKFNRKQVGRGVPETVYSSGSGSTSWVETREVDRTSRNVTRTEPISMSTIVNGIMQKAKSNLPAYDKTQDSILQEINRLKEKAIMEEENKKGRYSIPWWNAGDPFKATREVLNRYGNGPLPTVDKMVLKDHLALELALEEKQKEKEDNERATQRDVSTDIPAGFREPGFSEIDYTEYDPVEDDFIR